MPEQDFELYLSLLSRFLRLKTAQRAEIADELRDHLEQRLEELTARGLSRGEAIRTALDEFGDAAELANHFTLVAHIRKRRLIMRLTFGTVATLAAALLLTAAFWPEGSHAPAPQVAVAQGKGDAVGPTGKNRADAPVAAADDDKSAVEAKLAERIGKIEFVEMPLSEVMEFLSDRIGIDILFDRVHLSEEGVALDQRIQLVTRRANLSVRAVLDLVLEPLQLTYTIRDGLIMVTTATRAAEHLQVQVYNVRDLLRHSAMNVGTGPGGMIGGMGGMGGGGGGMMGGMGGGFFCFAPEPREESGREGLRNVEAPTAELIPRGAQRADIVDDFGTADDVEDRQLAQGFGGGRPAGGGDVGGGAAGAAAQGAGGAGGGGMGNGGGAFMGGMGGRAGVRIFQTSLAQVIATTIDSDSWENTSGNGTIVQYHELLVVKNSQTVHEKIKALLEMMRASARELPGDDQGAVPAGHGEPRRGGAGAGVPPGGSVK